MNNKCPHCNHKLSLKEVYLPSVIECSFCENKSHGGSFIQILSTGLLMVVMLLSLLFYTATMADELTRKTLVIGGTLLGLLIGMYAIVHPVKLKTNKS